MLTINIITLSKKPESYWAEAAGEYIKRLGAFCRLSMVMLPPAPLPESSTPAQIDAALEREARELEKHLEGRVFALCVEGQEQTSEGFAELFSNAMVGGVSRVTFVIGSSHGLSERIKARADKRISLSRMTLPHKLALVVLLEQVYRAFSINNGSKYHK